jgi:hypothetical protein
MVRRTRRLGARLAVAMFVTAAIVIVPVSAPESSSEVELAVSASASGNAPGFRTVTTDGVSTGVDVAKLVSIGEKGALPGGEPGPSAATSTTVRSSIEPTLEPPLPTVPAVTTTAAPSTTAPPVAGIVFGVGPEADSATRTRLQSETPARMLTSWYNGPGDLAWMPSWRTTLVPEEYAAGNALHLVVFSDVPETTIDTPYGTACGRPYPLSDRFLDDMTVLGETFAGVPNGPPLYVTLFTEVQTYACTDNAWNPNPETNAYYLALKDKYLRAVERFHAAAPNARVSLGWGGWQTRWDDPEIGGGRSMFGHFADVLSVSDFQSFQAMQSDSNVDDIREMTSALGRYGPVMLAHYKPDNGSQATFDADVREVFTDEYLVDVRRRGLFAFSFMDDINLSASNETFDLVAAAIRRHAA